MSALGKYKFNTLSSIIVLILFIGYGLNQAGILTPPSSKSFNYEIPKAELKISSAKELEQALAVYLPDEEGLSNILKKANMNLEEFYEKTKISPLIHTNEKNDFLGLLIKIESSNTSQFGEKEAFNFISNDIKSSVIKFSQGSYR